MKRSVHQIAALALVAAAGCRRCDALRGDGRPDAAPIVAKAMDLVFRGCNLHAELFPDPPRVAFGDPASLTFRLTTPCKDKLGVMVFSDLGAYSVSATDLHGDPVPEVDETSDQKSSNSAGKLSVDAPYERQLPLERFVKFPGPGLYELTVTTSLELTDGHTRADFARGDDIRFQVAVPLEVTPKRR